MSVSKPEYQLARVQQTSSNEMPQFASVNAGSDRTGSNRRHFLGRQLPAAAMLALITSCSRRPATEVPADTQPDSPTQANPAPATQIKSRDFAKTFAHRDPVQVLAVSPKGDWLVSSSALSGLKERTAFKLWHLPEGSLARVFPLADRTSWFNALALTPDGGRIAVAKPGEALELWIVSDDPAAAGATVRLDTRAWMAAISPDGNWLAGGTDSGDVDLYKLPEGIKQRHLGSTDFGSVLKLGFTPDSQQLIVQFSKTSRVWPSRTDSASAFPNQLPTCVDFAIHPSGKWVAMAHSDRALSLWSLPDAKPLGEWAILGSDQARLRFSADGKVLVSENGGDVSIYSVANTMLPSGVSGGTMTDTIAQGESPRLAELEKSRQQERRELANYESMLATNRKALQTGVINGRVVDNYARTNLIRNVQLYTRLAQSLKARLQAAESPAVSRDSLSFTLIRTVALPSQYARGGRPSLSIRQLSAEPDAFALAPDARFMVCMAGRELHVWSLPEGKLLRVFLLADKGWTLGTFTSVTITPDGKTLIAGTFHGAIRLWSLEDGRELGCLMDLESSPPEAQGMTYEVRSAYGRLVTYTLPCGSSLPAGTTCTCDCVPGKAAPPSWLTNSSSKGSPSSSHYSRSSYCTCVPVIIYSDQNAKEVISRIDPREVLNQLASLPLSTWRYQGEPDSVKHLGPMAQDFAAVFGLGDSNQHIHVADAQGVALAAIQALVGKLREQERELDRQRGIIDRLEQQLARLELAGSGARGSAGSDPNRERHESDPS